MIMKRILLLTILTLGAHTVSAAQQLKLATIAPEGSAWMREMRAGAEAVKKGTEGRVELKFFPGGVQGNDVAVMRKIRLGQLQGGAFSSAELAPVVPDAQIYSLPFLFRDQGEVDKVRPEVDALMAEAFEAKGLVLVGLAGGGFTYLMSTRPVRNAEDLRTSKVWVPNGDYVAQIAFEAGGVKPIPLPLGDVYTALSTGLVDVVGNTTSGAIIFQWHTRIKYMIDIPLTYVMGLLALDKKAFDRLAPADQVVVREAIGAAFQRLDALNRGDNESARKVLGKQGVQLLTPASEEQSFWRSVGAAALARIETEKLVTPETFATLNRALANVRGGATMAAAER
jgi:TRAP-type C4-dicarboxylate transport system substrate-binding protein